MAALIVAGITVKVKRDSATKKSPERIGSSTRAYSGGLRSTVRAEKRGWSMTTLPMTTTDAAALEAAVALAAQVTCSGDILGASVTCEVAVADSPYLSVAAGIRRVLQLTLREV